jgi:hypothetical protein
MPNLILRSLASVCNRQYAYAKNGGFPQYFGEVRNVPQNENVRHFIPNCVS